jgi:putative Holliday junction resolvase
MRVLAVDLGDVRTGLALSDATNTIAGRAWTVTERNMERLADTVAGEAAANGVGEIVLGNPRNMDGSEGPRSEKSREFCLKLQERTAAPVRLWDERQTTVAAHGILRANGRRTIKHKQSVDAVAATLILEGYLNSLR